MRRVSRLAVSDTAGWQPALRFAADDAREPVARTSSLLCRGFLIRRAISAFGTLADWHSAIQQVGKLRYDLVSRISNPQSDICIRFVSQRQSAIQQVGNLR